MATISLPPRCASTARRSWSRSERFSNSENGSTRACSTAARRSSGHPRDASASRRRSSQRTSSSRRCPGTALRPPRPHSATEMTEYTSLAPDRCSGLSVSLDRTSPLRLLAHGQEPGRDQQDPPRDPEVRRLRARVPTGRHACIVVFSDASWANAENNLSQAGFLVFLAERSVLQPQGGRLTLLDWRSHRICRVCRSILVAECMSMEAGLDAAVQIRTILAEAFMPDYVASRSGMFQLDLSPAHQRSHRLQEPVRPPVQGKRSVHHDGA